MGGGQGLPEDKTLVGFGYLYGAYHRLVIGSNAAETGSFSTTGSLDRLEASLFIHHFLGDGFSTLLTIPTGTVRFDPGGGLAAGQRSGFGDLQLVSKYDFAALWGLSLEHPSLELSVGMALPTGKQETIGSLSPAFPPQIIGIGRAVFSFILGLDYTQFLHESFALKANFSMSQPMTETSQTILFGPAYNYGVGGLFIQDNEVFYAAQLMGNVQMPSLKAGLEITNSGSHVLGLDATIGKKLGDRVSVAAQIHLPLYIGTQGTQIAESFTISGAVTLTFDGNSAEKNDHSHDDLEAEHAHSKHSNDSEDTAKEEQIAALQAEIERLKQNRKDTAVPSEGSENPASQEGQDTEKPARKASTSAVSVRIVEQTKQRRAETTQKAQPDSSSAKKVLATKVEKSEKVSANQADISELARGGQSFTISDAVVAGKVTVVDFWADWCRPCKKITKMLNAMAADNSRLAVRKVEVPTFESPVAMQHLPSVSGLPVVWIFDAKGQLVQKLEGTNLAEVRSKVSEQLKSEK